MKRQPEKLSLITNHLIGSGLLTSRDWPIERTCIRSNSQTPPPPRRAHAPFVLTKRRPLSATAPVGWLETLSYSGRCSYTGGHCPASGRQSVSSIMGSTNRVQNTACRTLRRGEYHRRRRAERRSVTAGIDGRRVVAHNHTNNP